MMRKRIVAVILLATMGCSEGGAGDLGDSGPPDPASLVVSNPGSGGPLSLSAVQYWAYQIQNHYLNPQALVDSHYDLLVIDPVRSISDMTTYDDKLLVAKLRSSANHLGGNKLVVAYLDIGEAEDYRYYWQAGWTVGNPSFLLGADPDGWEGNFPVKFWDPAWKAIVFGYLDRILADGFDGIYLDWLEAYDFDPVKAVAQQEGRNPRLEMAKFVKEIADHCRAVKDGFLVIGQNGPELVNEPLYLATIDAQAQEHVWFQGDPNGAMGDIPIPATGEWSTSFYQALLKQFLDAGKPVFTVDYAVAPSNAAFCYAEAAGRGYKEYVTTVQLDRLTSTPPPAY